MAIIICKHCGNKVSDTVDTCIHCGVSLTEFKETKATADDTKAADIPICEDTEEKTVKKTQEEENKPLVNFDRFDESRRLALEEEFLKSDTWAMKYRQRKEEVSSYGAIVLFYFNAFLLAGIIFKEKLVNLLEKVIYNDTFDKLGGYLMIAGGVALLLCLGYVIAYRVISIFSIKEFVYMKKFQKWLREERNIDYIPPILTIKEQEKFDSVDLNNINF